MVNIEQKNIDELIPYARNARTHSMEQVAQIAASIKEFGFVNPVLLRDDNTIIAGHGRVLAARKLGLAEVPCIYLSHLTEAQARAYVLADNQLATHAGWEAEVLRLELDDLQGLGFEPSLLGFGDADLAAILGPTVEQTDVDADPQIDKADELRAKWGVETGQLWRLGEHRILCGDSTLADDVKRALDGAGVSMIITDPPYGMSAVSGSGVLSARYKSDIAGDEDASLARLIFLECREYSVPQVWWGANYYADATGPASCWFVWDKNNGANDQADAELAWTNLPGVVRMFKQASEKAGRVHPTQKHPELIKWCIGRCGGGEIVFDPFSGSGTTIIACEQLGRKCRAIEISPGYVAVAIQRWADATGGTPELIDG